MLCTSIPFRAGLTALLAACTNLVGLEAQVQAPALGHEVILERARANNHLLRAAEMRIGEASGALTQAAVFLMNNPEVSVSGGRRSAVTGVGSFEPEFEAVGEQQEPPEKRLASIVGVAVEEYGKAVTPSGAVISALELEEAIGFLNEARAVAQRLQTPTALLAQALVDSLAQAVTRGSAITAVSALHARFSTALGTDGALDLPTRSVDVNAGDRLYHSYCAACHGSTGRGDGELAHGMSPPPPAIGDAQVMAAVSPTLAFRIVSVGVLGTPMPAFGGSLTPNERWDVLSYVATLRGQDPVAMIASVRASGTAGQKAAGSTPSGAGRPGGRPPDDAVVAGGARKGAETSDLAFDAYLAFEPLEAPARTRDPKLVAAMERHFGDFRGAVRSGDLETAAGAHSQITRGMPRVLELAETSPSGWGAFFQAFLIILREGFEAILVIGAVVAVLVKTGHRERLREIWIGAGAGLGASAFLAVILMTVLKALPASREIIEGATMLVAVAVLFSVSYWMVSKVAGARWQRFIRDKVNSAISKGGAIALASTAFLVVFREGAETALFYQVLYQRPENVAPVTGGMLAGSVALAVIFVLFYRFGLKLPLRPFFAATSALLYYMAFVFMGRGVRELQEGNAVSITPTPGIPHIEALGVYPTVETVTGQLALLALLMFALWRTLSSARGEVATNTRGVVPSLPTSGETK